MRSSPAPALLSPPVPSPLLSSLRSLRPCALDSRLSTHLEAALPGQHEHEHAQDAVLQGALLPQAGAVGLSTAAAKDDVTRHVSGRAIDEQQLQGGQDLIFGTARRLEVLFEENGILDEIKLGFPNHTLNLVCTCVTTHKNVRSSSQIAPDYFFCKF